MSYNQNNVTVDNGVNEPSGPTIKKRGQFGEIWHRFKKNPLAIVGLCIIVLMVIMALSADIIAPGDDFTPGYNLQDWGNVRQFPSSENLLGTDHLGRDVLSRIVHGARVSLQVAVVVIAIGVSLGMTLGAIAGFYGGVVDNVIMRIIDVMLAIPSILLAIAIVAAMQMTGMLPVMIAVGVNAIPIYARTVRAQILAQRGQEFVEAARASGASDFRIVFRHILPNCMAPVIVEASMGMAGAILAAAGLSFIGLGLQPPIPEWGALLSEGRQFMLAGYWHLTIFPGLMIALVIFAFNMMGDGLRDALDPKLRSASFSKRKFRRMQRRRAEEMMRETATTNTAGGER